MKSSAITRRDFIKAISLGAISLGTAGSLSADESSGKRPNVVFILIDDMGWRDLCCYGSTYYETPNIDRLAGKGMIFTDAYTCGPNCARPGPA